jgi:hypothetical protein
MKNSTFKFRSGLEATVAKDLSERKIKFKYEETTVEYFKPTTKHKYKPDIELENGIFIEVKGFWKLSDRQKHLLLKSQHPEIDIRFVFGNSKNRIYKNSKTTYADFCNKHGIKFADKLVPKDWI